MIESSGPLLRGECSKCGLCCTAELGGEVFVCDYLIRMDYLGNAKASMCLMYERRTHHMPITLTSDRGHTIGGKCAADGTRAETRAIIARGIGRGCSLEVVA